ncbi:LPS assembly protein LptD [Vibrio fortis]|uniref:LPS assembly protein LptD n=1 Tax=Vibrio fortis TaxID=212667 RepID=UPI002F3F1CCE
MQCFSRTLLAASISSALFVPTTQAETTIDDSVQEMPSTDQCLIASSEDSDLNAPAYVEADRLEAVNGEKASYSGSVKVTQGIKTIEAETVTLHQQENIVVAEGNVTFNDGQFKATSDKVTNNLTTNEFELENTQYQMLCESGRGDARYIARTGKAVYELEDGTITSCPPGDKSWRLKASNIELDQDEESATFINPRFEVLDVPIFYLPYLTVPVGESRKTGFLYPTFSYGSSDGFETEIPFYWNIAPNYDLQTTAKYMSERGTQLNNEFRHLSQFGQSTVTFEYLDNDSKFKEKGSRWGGQFKFNGIYKEAWKFDVDYSKVSDVDYFTDVDSSIGNREDGQLMQSGEVAYRALNWDASLAVRDFQVLTETENQPYRVMPQLKFNYYAPLIWDTVEMDVISHISRFDTDSDSKPSATRVHVEPGIKVPLSTTWGSWTTEARLLGTYYDQDLDSTILAANPELSDTASRVIPEFRTHAGIILERDTTYLTGYTQTLEPQVQYLYVPKQDQSEIGLYDTTLLQTDYYGLFRSRKYSGVDRIAARYVTREYIEDNVGDTITNIDEITRDGISQAGLVTGYQFSPKWYASAQYYHDMNENIAIEWLANLRYKDDCWYVGVTYSNELRSWSGGGYSDLNSDPVYENNFSINFGIVGFGTAAGTGSNTSGFDSSGNSLEYGRPFFLNN